MPRLYAAADAYVMPSRGEGWGRPYMEAMAMGLPTIGSRWSGNLAFMHDGNAFLVDGEVKRLPASFEGRVGVTRKIRPFFPASGAWSDFGVSGYSVSGLGRGLARFGPLEAR